jgi:uncharacterized membrane protein
MVADMKTISILRYASMFGIPIVLGLIVLTYIFKIGILVDLLKVVLALVAIIYSAIGINEVMLHGKKR